MAEPICFDRSDILASAQIVEEEWDESRLDALVMGFANAFEALVIGNSIGARDVGTVGALTPYGEALRYATKATNLIVRKHCVRPLSRERLLRAAQYRLDAQVDTSKEALKRVKAERQGALVRHTTTIMHASLPVSGGRLCLSDGDVKRLFGQHAAEAQRIMQASKGGEVGRGLDVAEFVMRLLVIEGWLQICFTVANRLDDEGLSKAIFDEMSDIFTWIEDRCVHSNPPRRKKKPKARPKKDRRKLLSRLLRGT